MFNYHFLLSVQILFAYALESVAITTILGFGNTLSNRNAFPKRVHFGKALGLDKVLPNPNMVVIATTLRACGTNVRFLMPLFF